MAAPKLTGGLSSYYLAEVKHPQRENQPAYMAECEDIIRALHMTFDEGCEFKALWRTASARLGNGKPTDDPLAQATYDAEKRVHYAKACLRQYEQDKKALLLKDNEQATAGVTEAFTENYVPSVVVVSQAEQVKNGHGNWMPVRNKQCPLEIVDEPTKFIQILGYGEKTARTTPVRTVEWATTEYWRYL